MNRRLLAAAGLLLALAGCGSTSSGPAAVDQHRPRPTHSPRPPRPTVQPSVTPTILPSGGPTAGPTGLPTGGPTGGPISYPAHCTARDGNELPDPTCTPGALNPAVTQATIHQTICVPGWTSTVRPPVSYTSQVKRLAIAAYGNYAGSAPAAYELDHFVPLALGGAPWDVRNLWPETPPSTNPKDGVEFAAYKAVCSGHLGLDAARQAIATSWIQLGHQLGVPGVPAS